MSTGRFEKNNLYIDQVRMDISAVTATIVRTRNRNKTFSMETRLKNADREIRKTTMYIDQVRMERYQLSP